MILGKLYFGVIALWKYFWKQPEPPPQHTTINIVVKTEPSESSEPCIVEYDYNKY